MLVGQTVRRPAGPSVGRSVVQSICASLILSKGQKHGSPSRGRSCRGNNLILIQVSSFALVVRSLHHIKVIVPLLTLFYCSLIVLLSFSYRSLIVLLFLFLKFERNVTRIFKISLGEAFLFSPPKLYTPLCLLSLVSLPFFKHEMKLDCYQ